MNSLRLDVFNQWMRTYGKATAMIGIAFNIAHHPFWNFVPKGHGFVFPITKRNLKLNASCELFLEI